MEDTSIQAIISHAAQEFPREACGLLINISGKEHYFPCRNTAIGTDNFCLHHKDYAAAEDLGNIVAVVHSHPNASPNPSQADRVACEASGLPWHILGYPSLEWDYIQPEGYRAPLVGREFSHGVLDCYTLIRDWYAQERGVNLPDFKRHDEWWQRGENLYLDNFTAAGFERVHDSLEIGDVLLMQVLSNVPNHGAVYLGDDVMLHHLMHRLSSREIYGGYWKKHTTHILRFKGMP